MKTPGREPLVLLTCAVLWGGLCGCGDKLDGLQETQKRWTLQNFLKKLRGQSPKQNVAMAFDPNDADRRREGILALSERKWGLKEPYLKGYAAILKTDEDPLVRSAAVRALGKAKDPKYLDVVARSLLDRVVFVRQDAATALDGLVGDAAVGPLRDRAANDIDQDVRANCAKALRHYRRDDVAQTLVACLSDKAFSVRHEAHASLVELTGRDLGYEPQDWANVTLQAPSPDKPQKPDSWWDRLWRRRKKPTPPPPPKAGK